MTQKQGLSLSRARSQLAGRLVRVVPAIDFCGTLQGFRDAPADIFRADVTLKLCLLHELRRLFSSAAEKQRAPRVVKRVREIADGAQAGGVNRGHVSQTKDDDG